MRVSETRCTAAAQTLQQCSRQQAAVCAVIRVRVGRRVGWRKGGGGWAESDEQRGASVGRQTVQTVQCVWGGAGDGAGGGDWARGERGDGADGGVGAGVCAVLCGVERGRADELDAGGELQCEDDGVYGVVGEEGVGGAGGAG
ncbi:hypothetical protein PMAC_000439 [Pneumocystis sp. 'macacae']|nr:hypothetical protein PMAC_000439 [Pneumocystis sp. 'macacae']